VTLDHDLIVVFSVQEQRKLMSLSQKVSKVPSAPHDPPIVEIVKGQTQIVFLLLDPVLKTLLKAIAATNELFEKHHTSSSDEVSNELWFRLVDTIVVHLEVLIGHVQSFGVDFAPAMILLADYVTLPLTAIFHLQLPKKVQQLNSKVASDQSTVQFSLLQRQLQIQTSYLRKLLSSTAKAVQSYVEVCSPSVDVTREIKLNASFAAVATTLGEKYLIRYLVALASCLPSSSDVKKLSSDKDVKTKVDNVNVHVDILLFYGEGSLDDGSDTWVAILQATRCVTSLCSEQGLLEAWQGTLLIRLVDCSTSLLDSRQHNGQDEDGFCFSLKVQMAAVDLIHTMLDRTPTAMSLWQSVFPGVFAPLYQRIMTVCAIQQATTKDGRRTRERRYERSLEIKSIGCVVRLISNSLKSIHPVANKESPGNHPIVPTPTWASVAEGLTNMMIHSNKKKNPTCLTQDLPHDNDSSSSFLRQIRTKVAVPLTIMLNQKAVSPSESTRNAVLSLCRLVLIDTRCCWCSGNLANESAGVGSSSSNTIEQVPFELCLALQQDLNGTYRFVKGVLTLYCFLNTHVQLLTLAQCKWRRMPQR
jgi:hypothetical protein